MSQLKKKIMHEAKKLDQKQVWIAIKNVEHEYKNN
jgi:hypothetical protein